MTLVAHLSRSLGFSSHFTDLPRFRYIMSKGFLTVDSNVAFHCENRSRRMMVVRSSNDNGVDLFAKFVIHFAVIRKDESLFNIAIMVF